MDRNVLHNLKKMGACNGIISVFRAHNITLQMAMNGLSPLVLGVLFLNKLDLLIKYDIISKDHTWEIPESENQVTQLTSPDIKLEYLKLPCDFEEILEEDHLAEDPLLETRLDAVSDMSSDDETQFEVPATIVPAVIGQIVEHVEIVETVAETESTNKRLAPSQISPQASKSRRTDASSSNSVKGYLDSAVGKLYTGLYNSQKFDEPVRNDLAELIISCEFGKNTNTILTPARLKQLADEIVAIFPDEDKDTYYIPRRKKTDFCEAVNPRGKLYHKYRKLVTRLKKVDERSSTAVDEDEDEPIPLAELYDQEEVRKDLEWLKTSCAPVDEVQRRWKRTAPQRLQALTTHEQAKQTKRVIQKVQGYLDAYKALRSPQALYLLEHDFDVLYPGKKGIFLENYSSISAKLKLLATKHRVPENKDVCDPDLETLWLIPKLFKPRKVKSWKPHALEVQQGFILHVKDSKALDGFIYELEKKLRPLEKTIQPFVVLLGEDHSTITKCYVYFDKLYYEVESLLQAFDLCFKSYHALHAGYPCMSEAPWLFVQRAIYGIQTAWDSGIAEVSTKVKEYNNIVVLP